MYVYNIITGHKVNNEHSRLKNNTSIKTSAYYFHNDISSIIIIIEKKLKYEWLWCFFIDWMYKCIDLIWSMQWYVLIRYKTYIWGGVLSSECLPNCNCKHCIYYQHPYYEFSSFALLLNLFLWCFIFFCIAIDSLVFLLCS